LFDHVGIAVSDLAASERFYRTVLSVLGVESSHADAELVEWEDWAIGPTDREHPVTRGLHVGFRAPNRAAVDAFWKAGIDAGYRDDGAPGPRAEYGPGGSMPRGRRSGLWLSAALARGTSFSKSTAASARRDRAVDRLRRCEPTVTPQALPGGFGRRLCLPGSPHR
jgi:catechol 2,3-dioxygenase-like lactoylglutathione lyase family enzyme